MNYYNEHDPKTAAWLRELIKSGHIAPGVVTVSTLTPRMGISSDQSGRGRLDTESIPSAATCSFLSFATARYAQTQACVPHLKHGTHHNSRRLLVHQDCIVGISLDWSLVIASPLFADDTLNPSQDCGDETPSLTSPLWRDGKRQNTSISDFDLGELGKPYRNDGTHVQSLDWDDSSTGRRHRTSENRIFHPEERRGIYDNGGKY